MTKEIDRLVDRMEKRYPKFGKWEFEFEHPGVFVYHYRGSHGLDVYFTPDFDSNNVISIQVHDQGEVIEAAEVPFTNRTAENLFHAVKPYLEKYERGRRG